jgi:hypothetical protein
MQQKRSAVGAGLSKEGEANVAADGADITTGNRDGSEEQKCLPVDQLCLSVFLLLPALLPSPLFLSVADTSLQLIHCYQLQGSGAYKYSPFFPST